jgi:hypothetical protein
MILPLLARFWPYIAIAVLGFGLWASVKHSGALSARLDSAIEISNANAEIAARERAERDRIQSHADALEKQLAANSKKYASIKRSISDAPPSDDGPLSPVMLRTLDSLRAPANPVDGVKARHDPTRSPAM